MISRATLALMAAVAPLATEALRPAPGSALSFQQDTMRHLTTVKMFMKKGKDDGMDKEDPMEEMPMKGMPMDGMPMEDSAGGMPMDGMPMDGMPMEEMPEDMPMEDSAGGMPMKGMPMDGMPMEDSAGGMPMDGMPMEEMSMDDMPMEDNAGGVAGTTVVTDATAAAPTSDPLPIECNNIAQLAEATPDLSTLFAAVSAAPTVAADLSILTEDFTVFAPNNEAFAIIPPKPLEVLLNETDLLTYILELHIVPGAVFAEDLMDGDVLETLNGDNLTVSIMEETVYITAPGEGGTKGTVILADVEACNGVVHVMDSILIPGVPPVEELPAPAPEPTPLVTPSPTMSAVMPLAMRTPMPPPELPMDGMPMEEMPKDMPMDGMPMEEMPEDMPMDGMPMEEMPEDMPMDGMPMEEMPEDMPMDGMPMDEMPEDMPMDGMPMEDNAGDVPAPQPEIEVAGVGGEVPDTPEPAPEDECNTIAQLAEATPDLSTLFTAVGAAPSVAAALSTRTEDFTVFAPNNEVFALIPPESLEKLLNETDLLTILLELHIVPGVVFAEDLMDGDVLETLNGDNLTVSIMEETVYITAPGEGGTKGTVVLADVEACNGVVHVIDSILIPGVPSVEDVPAPGPEPTPLVTPSPDMSALMPPATGMGGGLGAPVPDTPEPAPEDVPAEDGTDAEVAAVVEAVPDTAEPAPQDVPAEDGKPMFFICFEGESKSFGPIDGVDGVKRGEGVTINSAGQCSWEEYAGGFDGFPSPAIDDGHEQGMDDAIKEMFPNNLEMQTDFLTKMIEMAKPVDLDYPQDKAIADGGERMRNIGKLNAACSQLITVQC